ncbi:MAG: hypothetical protein JXA15_13810 [Spirochaetales bacterium]|nr:hypothetical protein [Spirochaetales bacterium]
MFNSVRKVRDLVQVRNVMVSVSDKRELPVLAAGLVAACPGVRIHSTGGTYSLLRSTLAVAGAEAEQSLVAISDYTGQPEMQGGLVKTLDWKIYLGLLAEEGNASHEADLARQGAVAFDLVVASLYPFEDALASGAGPEELRQHVDIGGPSMLRAAAKNHLRVGAVSSPDQYAALLSELRATGGRLSFATRVSLAAAAFRRVADYDEAIARWMENRAGGDPAGAWELT